MTLSRGPESAIADFTLEFVYLRPGSLWIEHLGSFTYNIDLKIVEECLKIRSDKEGENDNEMRVNDKEILNWETLCASFTLLSTLFSA